ncbi:restriction endonuclease subunit S [Alphaproteobacteria bacterium]|nr:restriction endonuclease subunit S [Alphaproteobacteria bacterium]
MWKTVKLGDVCDLVGGGTPSKKNDDYYDGDIPWATVRDMSVDELSLTEHKITELGLKNSSSKVIPENNVVIASRVGLGKVCILRQDTAINQDLRGVIPKRENEIDKSFLFYWFKGIASKIIGAGRGATVQGVTLPFLNSLPFPLPPLAEQQRIVAKLDAAFAEIDGAIDSANAQINNIDMLRKRILNGWIEKNASPEDYCTVQDCIDKEWLKQPFDGNHGEIHPKASDYTATGVPFIMARDLSNGEVNLTKCKFISHEQAASLRVGFAKNNDVLFTHKGTIGEVALLKCQVDFVMLTPQVTAYRVIDESRIDRLFLYYLFKSVFFQSQIQQIAGIGTTRAYIGITRQKQLSLCLPSIELQQQAVSVLNNSEPYVSAIGVANKNKLEQLSKLKSSILAQELQSEAA